VKKLNEANLALFFVKSAAALGLALPRLAAQMVPGRTLWICWPKRTSTMPCDLTLTTIRAMVAAYDMVDSKLCAIDATWSGTAITKRRRRATTL